MKIIKSYTCIISGNKRKVDFLDSTLKEIENLSNFVFWLGKDNWTRNKQLYYLCRQYFPKINSNSLQPFLKLYFIYRKKLYKTSLKPLILMNQNIHIFINNTNTISSFWLRFNKINFPLISKNLFKILDDYKKLKQIQIYKKENKFYCKLTFEKEIEFQNNPSKIVGLDVNFKRIVLSNNKFYKLLKLAHRKMEHKKNNQKKRNLTNYSKDIIHKITSKIVKDLSNQGIEVLVLEDLKNLRKNASREKSYNKKWNYIINIFPYRMIQNFLKYKCLDKGIQVGFINPAYTSKTCSRCSSLNTERPKQNKFACLNCNFQLDADLNGSRNIEKFYKKSQWDIIESIPMLNLKIA